jgi:hypothetical protein
MPQEICTKFKVGDKVEYTRASSSYLDDDENVFNGSIGEVIEICKYAYVYMVIVEFHFNDTFGDTSGYYMKKLRFNKDGFKNDLKKINCSFITKIK